MSIISMQLHHLGKRNIIVIFLIGVFALPLSAEAFSLTAIVEAHQERMQRGYERMSHRLCSVVSTLLPFVVSERCVGERGKSSENEESVLPVSARNGLLAESIFEFGTSMASSTEEAGITATTSTSTLSE
jgi:hypothetical protein